MIHQLEGALENKTRVVLYTGGENNLSLDILLHTLKHAGKFVDVVSKGVAHTLGNNDFIIIEICSNTDISPTIQSNIAFVSTGADIDNAAIVNSMASGGVLIYPNDRDALKTALSQSSVFFRKIEFMPPSYKIKDGRYTINTDLGEIPVNMPDNCIRDIEGIRLTAQQLGIMEDEFYENLISYLPVS